MTNSRLKAIKKAKYTDIISLFIISRIVYLVIMLLSGFPLATTLQSFDAEFYLNIARNGYSSIQSTAFFPLFPMVIRFTTLYGALLINNLAFLASLFILKKLGSNTWVLAVFALGPMGFFSMLLYTESLFFFFTVFAFYLMKNRKYPLLMGIALGLSVLTRSSGSMLFFAIFIGMCIQFAKKEIKFRSIIIAYVPATVLALIYPVYLQTAFGNWKQFVDCQFTDWNKIKSNIFKTIWTGLKMIFTDAYPYRSDAYKPLQITNEVLSLFLLALFVIYIVTVICSFIKKRKVDTEELVLIIFVALTLYAVNTTIRDPYLDSPTVSFYRYYYGTFPICLMMNKKNIIAQELFTVFTAALGMITSFVFCLNFFFY
ncbi:MAG: hypothetical protein MJ084_01390 [Saccharofermentans sp.]|nr:hypothetical protein [Saccharofermentans sp.]